MSGGVGTSGGAQQTNRLTNEMTAEEKEVGGRKTGPGGWPFSGTKKEG